MANRKGLSAPVPTPQPRSPSDTPDRRAAVSASVPGERGRPCLEGTGGLWALTGTRMLLGRAGGGVGADIEIADDSVSRRHAEFVATPEGWRVRDLGSVNGTVLEERPLVAGDAVPVVEGQVLRVGVVELRLVMR